LATSWVLIEIFTNSVEEVRQLEEVKIISVGVSFRGKILRRVGVMLVPQAREALDT
jgi:hypothetical protein